MFDGTSGVFFKSPVGLFNPEVMFFICEAVVGKVAGFIKRTFVVFTIGIGQDGSNGLFVGP